MRALAVGLLLVAGCVGGEPRRPGGSDERRIEPEYGSERRATEPDPRSGSWSVDAHVPRSGDPARPNVKVEVTVLDVASARELVVRGRVQGGLVRGVVDLRATFEAGAREGRARSRSSTFIVVQAGRAGAITLSDDARRLCGPYAGLHVHVVSADLGHGVTLALGAYAAPTAVPGESVEGATEVTLAPGQAVVLGGVQQSDARESRGLGHHAERESSRELLVLLTVDVIG